MKILKPLGITVMSILVTFGMFILASDMLIKYEAYAADVTYSTGGGSTMRLADQGDGTHAKVVTHRQQFLSAHSATGVSDDTYYVLLDLSDTANWPHTETTDLIITGLTMRINSTDVEYQLLMGPVMDITANTMTVRWMGSVEQDSTTKSGNLSFTFPGAGVDTDDIMAVDIAVAAVTTGSSLGSPNGSISVGVGDIVILVFEVSGTATAKWSAGVTYWTK